MQADLRRGEGASGLRGAGRLVAILAGAPLIAMLTLCAPDQTLAACGARAAPRAFTRRRAAAAACMPQLALRRRPAVAAAAEASAARMGAAPRACAGCRSRRRAGWSKGAPIGRILRAACGPRRRGPGTPARICTALGRGIAPEAAEVLRGPPATGATATRTARNAAALSRRLAPPDGEVQSNRSRSDSAGWGFNIP